MRFLVFLFRRAVLDLRNSLVPRIWKSLLVVGWNVNGVDDAGRACLLGSIKSADDNFIVLVYVSRWCEISFSPLLLLPLNLFSRV